MMRPSDGGSVVHNVRGQSQPHKEDPMGDHPGLRNTLPSVVIGLALLLAAGCHDTDPLEPDVPISPLDTEANGWVTANHASTLVPYHGRILTTQQTPEPSPPPGCQLFLHTTGEGEATHLGHFTSTGTTCGFNGQSPVLEPPINPGGGPPPFFVSEFAVEQTHTAANGDQLHIAGTGLLVQSLVDGSGGFAGSGTIEGGTGRFAGATGSFTVRGVSGEPARSDGWIAFDASSGQD